VNRVVVVQGVCRARKRGAKSVLVGVISEVQCVVVELWPLCRRSTVLTLSRMKDRLLSSVQRLLRAVDDKGCAQSSIQNKPA